MMVAGLNDAHMKIEIEITDRRSMPEQQTPP